MRDEESDEHPKSESLSTPRARASRSEFDFIEQVRRRALRGKSASDVFPSSLIPHPSSFLRDDAAVMRHSPGRNLLISADLLVEDIDFRRDWTSAHLLGHKALSVSLSDVAAMGATPRWALLSIGVPRAVWESRFLDEFYEGFFALADERGVTLVGGDVSRTPERIVVDSIVLGEVRHNRAVLRSGAGVGDRIYVTGALGGAAAGLRLLESGARLSKSFARRSRVTATERLLLRQLRPDARAAWGELLGEKRLATAMIDVSDGLSSDLTHVCHESNVGATIEAARVPVDASIERAAAKISGAAPVEPLDPLALALHGGEDYELLFTVNSRQARRVPEAVGGVPATYIGDVTEEAAGRVRLVEGKRRRILRPAGYEHFRPARPK